MCVLYTLMKGFLKFTGKVLLAIIVINIVFTILFVLGVFVLGVL
jgi:hypothetical protein